MNEWTTDNEIAAIKSFGFNGRAQSYDHQMIDRLRILRGYLAAAVNRKRWGAIDRKAAIAYAESLIHSMLEV